MPYRKSYRRGYRRRYRRRRKFTLYKTVRAVKRLKNARETKRFAVKGATTDISNTAWDITQINNIPQGDTRHERDGASAWAKSVTIRQSFLVQDAGQPGMIRVVIAWVSYTPEGLGLIENELFEGTDSGGTNITPVILKNKNYASRRNIHFVYDKVHPMGMRDNAQDSAAGPLTKQIVKNIRLNKKMIWGRNASGSGQQQGRLFLCYVNNFGTSTIQTDWQTILYYQDN